MPGDSAAGAVVAVRDLRKTFQRETGETVTALDGIGFAVAPGTLAALIGPDGAGKTTLMRLLCGLMLPDDGEVEVLGQNVSAAPQEVQNVVGYMPQKFGLYEDLSVQENLDLYADLHGVTRDERAANYPRLMEMTQLGRFRQRLAGKLSGGMKQKLGLACTLVRTPRLLLLDEPTVGVDPLSRRELWEIVTTLIEEDGLSVLVSTSYLDEAERCDHCVVLHEGRMLAEGAPGTITAKAEGCSYIAAPPEGMPARSLQARLFAAPGVVDAVPEAGKVRVVRATRENRAPIGIEGKEVTLKPVPARFEDGFMTVFAAVAGESARNTLDLRAAEGDSAEVAVEVRDLVRTFGDFTAVDRIGFQVRRGEIYGLLGPNGAGKSTTFRMLCGLLPASAGTLHVAGADLRTSRAEARERLGYVAQKFSLYGDLSVDDNLRFFASAYGLRGRRRRERIAWAKDQFDLAPLATLPSRQLPGGFKQRLAMAAALLHEPQILFLDEATSGADPLARREFWGRITALAESGVTVIVTTHFMEEAEYCDRIIIMDAGRALAEGTPAEVRARAGGKAATMEDAFIAIVEKARQAGARGAA